MHNSVQYWVELNERRQTDISEHLRTLGQYATAQDHVTEIGVRWICSTWGLLLGKPKTMLSIDINNIDQSMHQEVTNAATQQGTDWQFRQANILSTELQETDVLFIDTFHTYKQLKLELHLHGNKAKKYLIFHDTVTFGHHNEGVLLKPEYNLYLQGFYDALPNKQGLMPAVAEFIQDNPHWTINEHRTNNNGLLVLRNNNGQ